MKNALGFIAGLLAVAALVVIVPAASTFFGALCGWIVGLFFDETMAKFFGAFGLGDLRPWQIGAMLGFVGGFFRTSVRSGK